MWPTKDAAMTTLETGVGSQEPKRRTARLRTTAESVAAFAAEAGENADREPCRP